MSDYITLLGSEAVERAAQSMRESAIEMQRAASAFDSAVDRHIRAMEDFASRMSSIREEPKP